MDLNVRGVPDEAHAELVRRAGAAGVSLRAYVVGVLVDHCALPTVERWLDSLAALRPAGDRVETLEALRAAREEDDEAVAGA